MTQNEEAQLMTQLSISYNGRQYRYGLFQYDQLADAIAYARQRPGDAGSAPAPFAQPPVAPDEAERELMASLDITYLEGVYRLGEYRYNRLADAVNYARLKRTQGPS